MSRAVDVIVRGESTADHAAIAEVVAAAFGQPDEARLVQALRGVAGFTAALSLVAVRESRIVGHILFSPIQIERADRTRVDALALAPLAVLPECQRQGIGTQLAQRGLERCRRIGPPRVIVLGDRCYYERFGFQPAERFGITPPPGLPAEHLMAMALSPDALTGCAGSVVYSGPFMESG